MHSSLQRHSYTPTGPLKHKRATPPALKEPSRSLRNSHQARWARRSMTIRAMADKAQIGWCGVGTLGLPMVRHDADGRGAHALAFRHMNKRCETVAGMSALPVLKPHEFCIGDQPGECWVHGDGLEPQPRPLRSTCEGWCQGEAVLLKKPSAAPDPALGHSAHAYKQMQ
jgi:hypothetical protein